MQFDHIINTLDRIRAIVDDCRTNGLSELERDAILDELRKVYSAVRFADASYASCTAAEDESPVAPTVVPAASAEVVSESEAEPKPVYESETETEPEPRKEEQQSVPTVEPQEGNAISADVVSAEESVSEPKADKTEDTAAHEDNGGSRVQSLFDESEIAVNRRRRMIVRSLYDDVLPTESFAERSEPEVRAASEEPAPQSQQSQQLSDGQDGAEPVSISSELIEAPISVTFSHGYAAVYDDKGETVHSVSVDEPAYAETETEDTEDTVQAASAAEEPEPVQTAEPESAQMADTEPVHTAAEPEPQPEPAEESVLTEEPRLNGRAAADKADAVLGEVINNEVLTVADTIAAPENLASEVVRHGPALMLEEAIGVNDRFLLIRDLFDGDSGAYSRAVTELDSFDNLDDCMLYIVENYDWNPYSEGAKLLMGLIERKYGTRS